jgi:hypothetical protein
MRLVFGFLLNAILVMDPAYIAQNRTEKRCQAKLGYVTEEIR